MRLQGAPLSAEVAADVARIDPNLDVARRAFAINNAIMPYLLGAFSIGGCDVCAGDLAFSRITSHNGRNWAKIACVSRLCWRIRPCRRREREALAGAEVLARYVQRRWRILVVVFDWLNEGGGFYECINRRRPKGENKDADNALRALYDQDLASPYVMSVFVALTEKGLPFELHSVDLAQQGQHAPGVSWRFRRRGVPTLTHRLILCCPNPRRSQVFGGYVLRHAIYRKSAAAAATARLVQAWTFAQ